MLSAQSAVDLGLLSEDESREYVLMAISHDCDIATDNLTVEPTVEFVIGELIAKADGTYTRAKNARTLHLEFETPEGQKAVAFAIRKRKEVEKTALADHVPDTSWSHASPRALISLRWWLAARYLRSSFPDTFEARLCRKGIKLDDKIDKLISPHGDSIYGIFFLVDDGSGKNRNEGDAHELIAALVYSAESGEEAIKAIKKAADDIAAAFKAKLYDKHSGEWKEIELVSCEAISDEAFSFADSRIFKQWRLEHRSLENDSQPLPVENV